MQVVDKDMYKKVLVKVVDKVLKAHPEKTDASFLIGDAGRVQRLVQDYIRHFKSS
jgi:hypothetical protein